MNAPLRCVALSVLVLFTLLIINVNYIQVVRSDELRTNSSNTRVLAAEYDRERGAIIVDGEPVALSVPTDGRLRYLRNYPEGALYAAVTGYHSIIYNNAGIERAENDILSGQDPGVAPVVAQLVGPDDLDVVDVDDQQREEHQHADGHSAERGVHCFTTSVGASPSRGGGDACGAAGRRAASLIRTSSATRTKLATSDEPP